MKSLPAVLALMTATCSGAPQVAIERTPDKGVQPQTMTDKNGTIHLLYYAGDPKAGDLFYTQRRGDAWLKPIRVNTAEGSAIAMGTIRGGQMALGKGGRVHVVWNGAKSLPGSSHEGAPMFYTRLDGSGGRFESQRDLITFTGQLDGGGSVAADREGNIYVAWHGHAPDAKPGEAGRAVYIAKSTDDGATFGKERAVNPEPTGACGCCGMKAVAGFDGAIYLLYRAAREVVNRDEVLLMSSDKGSSFRTLNSDPWKIGTCPMSSAALTAAGERVLAAWETAGQVHCAWLSSSRVERQASPPGTGKRKHPFAAMNQNGETLLVWTDGTGWQRGGALAWQLFDKVGKPLSEQGRKDGVPAWSFASAYANTDGSFVILY